jgi:hypothetical protein
MRRQGYFVFGKMTPDVVRAHRHSTRHREEVLASEACGCFYCCTTFSPGEIKQWTDAWEGVGQTALCPRCGIDSVIGSESGHPVTVEFLQAMHARWF